MKRLYGAISKYMLFVSKYCNRSISLNNINDTYNEL
jgi:hypothetical protein